MFQAILDDTEDIGEDVPLEAIMNELDLEMIAERDAKTTSTIEGS